MMALLLILPVFPRLILKIHLNGYIRMTWQIAFLNFLILLKAVSFQIIARIPLIKVVPCLML